MRHLLYVSMCLFVNAASGEFVSPSSVDEVRERISELPQDEIWWTIEGDAMAWHFRNLPRMFPMAPIYRDGPVRELPRRPKAALANARVTTPSGEFSLRELIDSTHSTVMGMMVVHDGAVVYEHYPRMQPHEKPIYWSVTKVLASTLIGILEGEERIDVDKPVSTYVPRLAGSSYRPVTVRNVLDMAAGLNCLEEYEDKTSCYYRYSVTVGDGFYTADSPGDPYAMLAALEVSSFAPQGTAYAYSGVNTFVLAWVVEEITGMPFQDAVSRYLWTRMGAHSDAAMLAPRFGVPNAHGGLVARVEDVARFGMLFTPSAADLGAADVIPQALVEHVLHGGNPDLLEHSRYGDIRAPGVRHAVYQWDRVFDNDDMFKGGWAGQGLLVNPRLNLVAVYTGYFGEARKEVAILGPLRSALGQVYGDD
tara:strand:+ start:3216 stop:4478 length:1263 start_codon:yes stop_codon:yes gene_type:complete